MAKKAKSTEQLTVRSVLRMARNKWPLAESWIIEDRSLTGEHKTLGPKATQRFALEVSGNGYDINLVTATLQSLADLIAAE